MDELLEILNDIDPTPDYENCEDLIDAHRLSSLSIIALVAELEEAFDITVPATQIIPANLNSARAIWAMVERLQEDEDA